MQFHFIEPQTQGVLFDIDGTLVNTIPMILAGLRDTYRALGVNPTDSEIFGLIGTPLRVQLNLFGLDQHPTSIIERLELAVNNYRNHRNLIEPFAPMMAAYNELLSAKIKVGLVTSRNALEVEHIIEDFPELAKANVIVHCDTAARPKPAPDPAIFACDKLGISCESSVFIGDSEHDMKCAKSAGTYAIAVSYGACSSTQLAANGADITFDTPQSCADWIQTNITSTRWITKN